MIPSSSSLLTITLTLLFISLSSHQAESISCDNVISFLSPCMSFMDDGKVSHSCCYGVKRIYKAVKSSNYDLRMTCSCLKQEAASYYALTADTVNTVTGKCRVKLPFEVTKNINCSKLTLR
ncbi:hypothetical protein LUZ60_003910 [Juncus effusus]|nr:hypothetical protein LUZ60_003910 [Juncus effusus]